MCVYVKRNREKQLGIVVENESTTFPMTFCAGTSGSVAPPRAVCVSEVG